MEILALFDTELETLLAELTDEALLDDLEAGTGATHAFRYRGGSKKPCLMSWRLKHNWMMWKQRIWRCWRCWYFSKQSSRRVCSYSLIVTDEALTDTLEPDTLTLIDLLTALEDRAEAVDVVEFTNRLELAELETLMTLNELLEMLEPDLFEADADAEAETDELVDPVELLGTVVKPDPEA